MRDPLVQVFEVFGVLVAVVISCAIARCAAGKADRVSAWWGLLGPVGWVVAALRGVQERLDNRRGQP